MSGDPLAATPKKPTIAFLGDSITTGQYVNFVQNMIPGCTVHRYAKSGYTSEQIKREFLEDALKKNPSVIVIMAGANDIWQGKDNDSIIKNINAMLTTAGKKGIPVVLVTIPPMNGYKEEKDAGSGFDGYIERNLNRGMDIDALVDGAEHAEKRTGAGMTWEKHEALKRSNLWIMKQNKAGRIRTVDIYSMLEDKARKNRGEEGYQKKEYTTDGLHFSKKGHAVLAKAVESAIRTVLAGSKQREIPKQRERMLAH